MKLTYSKSGVNYNLLDPVKRMGQIAGLKTALNIKSTGIKELSISRGETAYLLEDTDCYYALVQECLGTKNLIADKMLKLTGKTYYDLIAQDTVAMIINDLVTMGARPLTILAYWSVGDSKWWQNKKRLHDLVSGWKKSCDMAGATWGGGETPSNSGVVLPDSIDLAGSAFGIIRPKKLLINGDNLRIGDAVIMFESSGVHANGISITRKIADRIPEGYQKKIGDGRMFGEELLSPTTIYSKLINDLLLQQIDIHYIVNITGHGWRKLMRARKNLTYLINLVPPIPEIFTFIKKHSRFSLKEMYGTFNMGTGFAVFVPEKEVKRVIKIAGKHKIKAFKTGRVEKGPRKVIIKPLNISFTGSDLRIRQEL